jgi:hypothetical protein
MKILVVELRKREFLRPCHLMTPHRHTPLPPHSLNWMINRMFWEIVKFLVEISVTP